MPVRPAQTGVVHRAHGSSFTSYVAPSLGSRELCAWRLDVPPNQPGVPHRPTREEVLLVLEGRLHLSLDGQRHDLGPGDVALVPAGSELCVDSGPHGAAAWVSTTPGIEAVLPDGARLAPPWAR